jgi:tricorn protease
MSRPGFANATATVLGAVLAVAAAVSLTGIAQTRPLVPLSTLAPLPSFAEPGISPDGREIAFVSGGDIWTVAAAGGDAHLLVSHAANESRPLFSPDGTRLAFVSDRTGGGDIYVLALESGDVRRLTFDDGKEQLDGWSRDGAWIYFSTTSHDIAGMNDVLRVPAAGGTPTTVSGDRYVNEYFAAPSPDGRSLAISARGMASSQWWRKGHSHIDEAEIWVLADGATNQAEGYRRLTDGGAKEMWPMWSGDGRTIYYVSDRSGAENVWARPAAGGPATRVTQFKDGRVLWPSIANDGKTIVFERDFGIWRLDVARAQANEVKIVRRGAPAGPAVEHVTITNDLQDLALSPDGRKVAFVAHGEVFAASAKDGGEGARVTNSPASEAQPAWAADSRRLVYTSDRDGVTHLYLYDFRTGAETQLTQGAEDDSGGRFSPDGKLLAFVRDQRELRVLDVEARTERLVTKGYLGNGLAWSPDSKWIAMFLTGTKGFTNVAVVPAAGGEPRPVSFLANSFGGALAWSPDSTYLLFSSSQRTETPQIARIDLTLKTPRFREDQFRDLFQDEMPRPSDAPSRAPAPSSPPAPASPKPAPEQPAATAATAKPAADAARKPAKPVEIVFDEIRRRLTLLPIGVEVGELTISPDGKWLVMVASAAGQQNLYVYPLDELAKEPAVARQLTSTAGSKRRLQITPDSKEVLYLENGRIQAITLERREPRAIAVSAELDVDFAAEKMEVFHQAWTTIRDVFFDAGFNGVDWASERTTYGARVAGARTPEEMRRLISLMLGDLNASHSGISGPGGGGTSVGRLGLVFDRTECETAGRLRVTAIVPLGPAAVAGAVKIGDYVLAVDGTTVGPRTNLDQLLSNKIAKRTVLAVASSSDGKDRHEVPVQPVSVTTEKGLLYREWVEANRAYVAKISNGRLGYVHMIDMGAPSLAQLHVDLDADNHGREGVVVDVRNNNGGFVNVYAIDVFARRPYLVMTPRRQEARPARVSLGQRALEAPTILVTNMHSLSDAEDFTEGYRALKLGKVVGEPTAGWIIYTGSARMIDGSSVRTPGTRITTADGQPMEMHPRAVDVAVTRPPGESYARRDAQLDAAVRELLAQLGAAKTKANQ